MPGDTRRVGGRSFQSQTINTSPLPGGHAPKPIEMLIGILSGVPDVIISAKFYVNRRRSRGFSGAAPPKAPFPILIRTTLTTVLHYRADCDNHTLAR